MVGVVYEAGQLSCDVPAHPPTSEHPGYLAPPGPPTPSSQAVYHCEPTPTTLALGFPPAHRSRPPTGEEVACGVCGKVLCNKYVLKIHVRDMHGPRQSHQCPVCRRMYASLNSLRAHMSGTHKKTNTHPAQQPPPPHY
uniref:C2H2-type domain-containing protein n=1 Tax=Scylla olivacea TaxID=85551 RepID=A0A0P4WGA9_SCYOL